LPNFFAPKLENGEKKGDVLNKKKVCSIHPWEEKRGGKGGELGTGGGGKKKKKKGSFYCFARGWKERRGKRALKLPLSLL